MAKTPTELEELPPGSPSPEPQLAGGLAPSDGGIIAQITKTASQAGSADLFMPGFSLTNKTPETSGQTVTAGDAAVPAPQGHPPGATGSGDSVTPPAKDTTGNELPVVKDNGSPNALHMPKADGESGTAPAKDESGNVPLVAKDNGSPNALPMPKADAEAVTPPAKDAAGNVSPVPKDNHNGHAQHESLLSPYASLEELARHTPIAKAPNAQGDAVHDDPEPKSLKSLIPKLASSLGPEPPQAQGPGKGKEYSEIKDGADSYVTRGKSGDGRSVDSKPGMPGGSEFKPSPEIPVVTVSTPIAKAAYVSPGEDQHESVGISKPGFQNQSTVKNNPPPADFYGQQDKNGNGGGLMGYVVDATHTATVYAKALAEASQVNNAPKPSSGTSPIEQYTPSGDGANRQTAYRNGAGDQMAGGFGGGNGSGIGGIVSGGPILTRNAPETRNPDNVPGADGKLPVATNSTDTGSGSSGSKSSWFNWGSEIRSTGEAAFKNGLTPAIENAMKNGEAGGMAGGRTPTPAVDGPPVALRNDIGLQQPGGTIPVGRQQFNDQVFNNQPTRTVEGGGLPRSGGDILPVNQLPVASRPFSDGYVDPTRRVQADVPAGTLPGGTLPGGTLPGGTLPTRADQRDDRMVNAGPNPPISSFNPNVPDTPLRDQSGLGPTQVKYTPTTPLYRDVVPADPSPTKATNLGAMPDPTVRVLRDGTVPVVTGLAQPAKDVPVVSPLVPGREADKLVQGIDPRLPGRIGVDPIAKVPGITGGELRDTSGRLIDSTGRLVDTTGRVVDSTSGRVIDNSGRLVDNSGRVVDTTGRVVDGSGRVVDNAGRVIDINGRVVDMIGRLTDTVSARAGEVGVGRGDRQVGTGGGTPIIAGAVPSVVMIADGRGAGNGDRGVVGPADRVVAGERVIGVPGERIVGAGDRVPGGTDRVIGGAADRVVGLAGDRTVAGERGVRGDGTGRIDANGTVITGLIPGLTILDGLATVGRMPGVRGELDGRGLPLDETKGQTKFFWPLELTGKVPGGSFVAGRRINGFQSGGHRALPGLEIILTSLLAAAAIARVRDPHSASSQLSGDAGDELLDEDFDENDYLTGTLGKMLSSLRRKQELMERHGGSMTPEEEWQLSQRSAVYRRPVHMIGMHETLVSIAERYYHDGDVAWLIADLNKSRIKESWLDGKRVVEVQNRMNLEMPVAEDLEAFYMIRSVDALASNLVTIVQERQVDREIVDEFLGKIVGAPTGARAREERSHAPADATPKAARPQTVTVPTARHAQVATSVIATSLAATVAMSYGQRISQPVGTYFRGLSATSAKINVLRGNTTPSLKAVLNSGLKLNTFISGSDATEIIHSTADRPAPAGNPGDQSSAILDQPLILVEQKNIHVKGASGALAIMLGEPIVDGEGVSL